MYYKSYRIIDGKPAWVISDEDNNIFKDPTIEMKKLAVFDSTRKRRDSEFGIKERKCCKCHNDIPKGRELRYYDEKDEWNGESYLCIKCYKNSSKYDRFRVDTRIYNDAYQELMEFLKDKRFFTIEDIKKWLKVGNLKAGN